MNQMEEEVYKKRLAELLKLCPPLSLNDVARELADLMDEYSDNEIWEFINRNFSQHVDV